MKLTQQRTAPVLVKDALGALSAYSILITAASVNVNIFGANVDVVDSSESVPLAAAALIDAFLTAPPHVLPSADDEGFVVNKVGNGGGGLLRAARMTGESHVRIIIGTTRGGTGSGGRDTSQAQAAKDVERDIFCINGCVVAGCAGYNTVVSSTAAAVNCALAHEGLLLARGGNNYDMVSIEGSGTDSGNGSGKGLCSVKTPSYSDSYLTAAIASVLTLANRTASGGDAYEAALTALELTQNPTNQTSQGHGATGSGLLLVADSRAAPPIQLDIDAGPYLTALADVAAARADAAIVACRTDVSAAIAKYSPSGCASVLLADACAWAERIRLGARVRIRATTCFAVVTDDPTPARVARVTATYGCDVGWLPNGAALDEIGKGGAFIELKVSLDSNEDEDGE